MSHTENDEVMDDPNIMIDEVMLMIGAFAEMGSVFHHLSGQHPLVASMSSQWLATLLWKLQEWGALTETQHRKVMRRVEMDTAERQAQIENKDEDERVQGLLAQLGI